MFTIVLALCEFKAYVFLYNSLVKIQWRIAGFEWDNWRSLLAIGSVYKWLTCLWHKAQIQSPLEAAITSASNYSILNRSIICATPWLGFQWHYAHSRRNKFILVVYFQEWSRLIWLKSQSLGCTGFTKQGSSIHGTSLEQPWHFTMIIMKRNANTR